MLGGDVCTERTARDLAAARGLPPTQPRTYPAPAPQTGNRSSIDMVELEVVNHCSRLPGGDAAERCWSAYRYLEDKISKAKAEAEAGCTAGLDRLNDLAQQLAGSGSCQAKVAVLSALAAAERRRLQGGSDAATAPALEVMGGAPPPRPPRGRA